MKKLLVFSLILSQFLAFSVMPLRVSAQATTTAPVTNETLLALLNQLLGFYQQLLAKVAAQEQVLGSVQSSVNTVQQQITPSFSPVIEPAPVEKTVQQRFEEQKLLCSSKKLPANSALYVEWLNGKSDAEKEAFYKSDHYVFETLLSGKFSEGKAMTCLGTTADKAACQFRIDNNQDYISCVTGQ